MTSGYKERRAAKHIAQKASRVSTPDTDGVLDLTDKTPRHAFVGLKSRPQANGGRKNRSGYAEEHAQANIDNAAFDEQKKFEAAEPVNELER